MPTKTLKAKYTQGVIRPKEKLNLPEGTDITVHLELPETLSDEERIQRFRSAAGAWKNLIDAEKFIKDVYEERKLHTRPEVIL